MYTISIDCSSTNIPLPLIIKFIVNTLEECSQIKFRLFISWKDFSFAVEKLKGYEKIEIIECNLIADFNTQLPEIYYDVESGNYNYTITRAINDSIFGSSHACIITGVPIHASIIASKLERKLGSVKVGSPKCLAAVLPTPDGFEKLLLDVGASSENNLFDLAILGETFGKWLFKAPQKVSFLNTELEDSKSIKEIRKNALVYQSEFPSSMQELLIRPEDLLKNGPCTVAICNGFHGNLVMQTIEATLAFNIEMNKKENEESFFSTLYSVFPGNKSDFTSDTIRQKNFINFLLGFGFPIFCLKSFSEKHGILNSGRNIFNLLENFPLFLTEFNKLEFTKKESLFN